MQHYAPFYEDRLIKRDDLILALSGIRYPTSNKSISRVTFWRWCGYCGIRKRLSFFDEEQCRKLAYVAQLFLQGYGAEYVESKFGVTNESKTRKQRVYPSAEQPESDFEFSTGYGSGKWNFAEIGRGHRL